ncbi:MAG: hypothetical protein A2275_16110 [Bacteroidetes bacterium RIFOXYA12_FULL_35_11]|nr:MAG: hypothetical protein A2X01_05280 [Bacteroidetes bacterium GWF2_35_48]OFY75900.1 MAG: hypothetical protein A2275_16110 [Bacteroidetes bacterium RIFOXYA12_FULL_35_11]OFY92817.1 MAG: hypothetical protein A2491_07605 [Bacteroidetes bacterium RIFOXYC12_FULL_35_7]HBX52166.1 hypothetical protein [Bacteroidales bacterium]
MKKLLLFLTIVGFISSANAQLIDEKNVTVTMELQPILQLNMTTPDHVEFVFDDIREYYSGIIKYGATILKVSSTVNWDLYAVGTSTTGTVAGQVVWDNQISYSTAAAVNSVNEIPISALELHQYEPNNCVTGTGTWDDYSTAFPIATGFVAGQNSIFESTTPYTAPGAGEKYIQGMFGVRDVVLGDEQGALAGSYLTAGSTLPTDYYYVIDYRILPGLPAVFPAAGLNDGTAHSLDIFPAAAVLTNPSRYAEPGVYTMNVKYVLLEDQ